MTDERLSSVVLRGRAVDVKLHSATGGAIEEVGLVFDCNALADLEAIYEKGTRVPVMREVPQLDDDKLVVLDEKTGKPVMVEEPLRDADGQTVWRLAYGVEAFEQQMLTMPFNAIRNAFSCLLGVSVREAGARMINEHFVEYFTAVGAALAIANGVDPTEALAGAKTRMERILGVVEQHFGENVDDATSPSASRSDTPGTSGAQPGVEPADS